MCKDVATLGDLKLAELHCEDSCWDLRTSQIDLMKFALPVLRFHKCSLYADAMWWWVVGGGVVRYMFITFLVNMFKV